MKGPRKSTEWRGVVRATRRLVEVRRQNDTLLAAYRYNGLNQRITWHYDADEDGDTDGSDPVYHFCYDDKWRIVGTWRGADTDPKEAFTYHNAGPPTLAGRGGSSYIDSVVLRDRDTNGGGGWTGASDGSLNARHYYAQNWRADVSGIFDNKGAVLEWVKYSAYGVPHLLTPGDHDKSGEVDKDDETAFYADYGTGNLRADLDEDGDVDTDDQTLFVASYNKVTPGGRWKLSSEDVGNRKGYAGYEHEGFGNDLAAVEIAHVRNRVLHFGLGRWTRRDPLGYVDGASLSLYAKGRPVDFSDPSGLQCPADPWAGSPRPPGYIVLNPGVVGCISGESGGAICNGQVWIYYSCVGGGGGSGGGGAPRDCTYPKSDSVGLTSCQSWARCEMRRQRIYNEDPTMYNAATQCCLSGHSQTKCEQDLGRMRIPSVLQNEPELQAEYMHCFDTAARLQLSQLGDPYAFCTACCHSSFGNDFTQPIVMACLAMCNRFKDGAGTPLVPIGRPGLPPIQPSNPWNATPIINPIMQPGEKE